jgi:FtsH-binding integral membrane protein
MSGTGSGKTNGMSVAGFVLSLLFCTAPLGLIFSAIGMNQTKKDPSQGGRGLAIAGLVIGIIFTVWLIFSYTWWIALLGFSATSGM